MAVLLSEQNRVVIQGATGRWASALLRAVRRWNEEIGYRTTVVAGVSPGHGGENLEGVPLYDTLEEAAAVHRPDTTLIAVASDMVMDAVVEALGAGIRLLVVAAEGVPIQDAVYLRRAAREAGAWLIGPNSPGIITVGKAVLGIMPAEYCRPGPLGVVSRSGTLSFEMVRYLTQTGWGQTTYVGIGGDPVVGRDLVEYLALFEADPETKGVVLLGEVGGSMEEDAADYVRSMSKPVFNYIVGVSVPPRRRMGHAGAIISGAGDTAQAKRLRLAAAGSFTAESPEHLVELIRSVLGSGHTELTGSGTRG